MYILGINGGVRAGYQDVSSVLIKDGKVVFALAEERINRKKHSSGQLPYYSIKAALDFAKINIKDVDYVATHGSTWGKSYENVLEEYLKYSFGHAPKIMRVHHHVCHAASAYYGSGFKEAMVLTMDASGDGVAVQKAIGKAGKIKVLEQESRTNSLGIFYSIMTQFCGFTRDTDEYKLMGLAPYGDSSKVDLSEVLKLENNGYSFDNRFLKELTPGAPQPSRQQAAYSEKLNVLLGVSRLPGADMTDHYMNVAAATQETLQAIVIDLVTQLHKKTGLRKLCLAGGVALNCEINRFLMNLDFIDEIFVQPASGDDGISLGAAWQASAELGVPPVPADSYYLGKAYSQDEVKACLDLLNINYLSIDNPAETAANLVAKDLVVAWYQGRDEFGPRALGARSIIANPKHPGMKRLINQKIKFREGFRPFCPSVLEEDASLYFTGKQKIAPYMTINYSVNNPSLAPSISHVNKTARIQTVNNSQNKLYWEYLNTLKKKIGVGMSINTSFNRSNEPVIHSPKDAISAFYGSGIDAMLIGDFLIKKD